VIDLSALGIKVGHTVTESVFRAAAEAGLPELAMEQLWPGRTINRDAMVAIDAAIAVTVETEQDESKE